VKLPTAVQLPADVHETPFSASEMLLLRSPAGNETGSAFAQLPFVDVTVKASYPLTVLAHPTVVQLPGEEQETRRSLASGGELCTPLLNTTGLASDQVPFVDVTVNASRRPCELVKCPTAVQFPGDVHETFRKALSEYDACTPSAKATTCGSPHTPLVDEIVNGSSEFDGRMNFPTAVQFPGDVQDTLSSSTPPMAFKSAGSNPARVPFPQTGSAVAEAKEEPTTAKPQTRTRDSATLRIAKRDM
jgi:hypothetical protein